MGQNRATGSGNGSCNDGDGGGGSRWQKKAAGNSRVLLCVSGRLLRGFSVFHGGLRWPVVGQKASNNSGELGERVGDSDGGLWWPEKLLQSDGNMPCFSTVNLRRSLAFHGGSRRSETAKTTPIGLFDVRTRSRDGSAVYRREYQLAVHRSHPPLFCNFTASFHVLLLFPSSLSLSP